MTNSTKNEKKFFEEHLLNLFEVNEGKYFTAETLISLCGTQGTNQEFLYDNFEKSMSWVNRVLGERGYYIEEKQFDGNNKICYASNPLDNPVSKCILPVDLLSRNYQEVSDPEKQQELWLKYSPFYEQLLKSNERLEFLSKQYGIKKRTVMKMKLGLDMDILSIPMFNYSVAQYPYYETPEVMDIKYVSLNNSICSYYKRKTISQLAMINSYSLLTSILVVVKDYKDGLLLWQFLNEEGLGAFYQIVLAPDGLSFLPELISQIEFDKYKTFYLKIGESIEANRISDEILRKYPMFKRQLY